MKAKTIRYIIIAMFVLSLSTLIAVEEIFHNPYINVMCFGVVFVVFCTYGAYLSDYIVNHDMIKDVLGKNLYEMIKNELNSDED